MTEFLLISLEFLDGIPAKWGFVMKNFMVIVFMLAFSCSGYSEETNGKVPVPEGFGTMEMEGMPELSKESKSKITFSSSCIDITGRTIKEGEAGYETCLSDVKLKSLNNSKADKSKSQNSGPQMNMNFNVGD